MEGWKRERGRGSNYNGGNVNERVSVSNGYIEVLKMISEVPL